MSLKYLENYLDKNPVVQPETHRKRTLIVVSDSKGSRLKNTVQQIQPEKSIVWLYKGGRSSFQAADFVTSNLKYFVEEYRELVIAIWVSTCDFTKFTSQSRRYIDLSNVSVEDILTQYQKILSASETYGSSVKIVFLECPQYSISIWNKNKGHPNPDSFNENTEILNSRIQELNQAIRNINSQNGVSAPKFGLDLLKSRKSNRSYTSIKVSYSLLNTDGIHPGWTLSRYWLRRIVHSICPLCYN